MSPTKEVGLLQLYFGERLDGFSVMSSPPNGDDRPDDMAQAWLDGDLERYQTFLEGKKPPKKTRRKQVDVARILELRRLGYTIDVIARTIRCRKQTVSRICRNLSTTPRTTQATPRESKPSTSASTSVSTAVQPSSTCSAAT